MNICNESKLFITTAINLTYFLINKNLFAMCLQYNHMGLWKQGLFN